jgi:hypothetical protein
MSGNYQIYNHCRIPAEFYTEVLAAEKEEEDCLRSLEGRVKTLYDLLRKVEIPAESARTIVVGRFIKYRSERRIIGYLPDEAKNKIMQGLAVQSNIKQRATREKLM